MAASLVLGFAARPGLGDTLTLKAAADTSLFERLPNNNLGRSWLAAGTLNSRHKARALIRFDLSELPANAMVTSVSVGLRVVKAPTGAVPSTFEVRRVLQPWVEGAQGAQGVDTGGAAGAGEATWISRGEAAWSSGGGANGTDLAAAASATGNLSGNALGFVSNSDLVADVQAWLQDPAQNFGWAVISQSEGTAKTARRFGSRETANNEPTLTIEYTAPSLPQPPTLVGPLRVGDRIQFQFPAEANHAYTAEAAANPVTGPWEPITNFIAAPNARDLFVDDSVLGAGRFYRVRSP